MNDSRLARLADLVYRRRGRVLVAWIVAFAAVLTIVPRFAGDFAVDFSSPGESQVAADIVERHFPGNSGQTVNVVWEAPAGADAAQSRVDRFLQAAGRVDGIGEPTSPRYSRDGTIGLVQLELERNAWQIETSSGKRLIELAEDSSVDGLRIELGGNLIQSAQEGTPPEMAGLIAAAFVLLIAFGSIVAAGLPLLVAIFGLGISATLIGIVALFVDVPDFAPAVAGLIGIGVGIDYALLILTRFRTALLGGAEVRGALAEALTTAGRSVIVAGGTVVISLFGLSFMGVSFLHGIAISASVAVLVVVLASITLLPALLAFAGRRVDTWRLPLLGRSLRTGESTLATRWSRVIQSHAAIASIGGAAVLLLLTAPVLGLRFGFPDEGNDREGTMTRNAYELVSRGFGPGASGPLLLATESPATLSGLAGGLRQQRGVAYVGEPRVSADGGAALLTVVPESTPQASATGDLVERLRERVGDDVYVGGLSAVFVDQSDYVAGRIPLFVGGVVLLSLLLLLAAFRAPVIALKAGLMNLLSVGAAYGVVALAAEGGAFGGLILSFMFSTEVFLKLMGVGMAAAILVDATVIRMVLVPAVMQLLGRANWWIPSWLDRALPQLDVEPPPPAGETA